jgi:hypothetical protein
MYARVEADAWFLYNDELVLITEGHINVNFVTNEGFVAYVTSMLPRKDHYSTVVMRHATALQMHLLDTPTLNLRTSCDPDIR